MSKNLLFSIMAGGLSLIFFLPSASFGQCSTGTSITTLDINNVNATMLNAGDMWWDFSTARYEIPAGSGRNALFAGALWIGGYDNQANLHMATQRYRQTGDDFWPGPIGVGGTVDVNDCVNFDRHWKIEKSTIDDFIAGNLPSIPNEILEWPARGNANLVFVGDRDLAPFVDVNLDNIYNPMDGDYPKIKGDQAVWWVMNDAGNIHTNSAAFAMGIEIHVMAYAYASNDVLNNTTFYDYKVINKSNEIYTDTYIGKFVDPDLGNGFDDYIGCLPSQNLGFCYNGDDIDEDFNGNLGYGHAVPVVGVAMVQPPLDDSDNQIPLSHFTYFNNGGPNGPTSAPTIGADYYNYLSGNWRDGSPFTLGGSGYGGQTPTDHVFPGNPAHANWSDCSENTPGDRRFIMSFGPFTFDPLEEKTFTYAAVWTRDSSIYDSTGCANIGPFLDEVQMVQDFSDSTQCSNFNPNVTASVQDATFGVNDGEIDLTVSGQNTPVSYSWSNGETTEDIANLIGGTYTVVVTNEHQCPMIYSFTVSNGPSGIDPKFDPSNLIVAPNPSSGMINISSPEVAIDQVKVFDLLGKQVLAMSGGSFSVHLDMSAHPEGIYLVKLTRQEHDIIKRIVVSR